MIEKINIAELLKDCPSGMELDSPVYDNLYFDKINSYNDTYPIICYTVGLAKTEVFLTKEGFLNNHVNTKCVIFPKGKTTWEGFVPPCKFKDGDIISNGYCVAIFYKLGTARHCVSHNIVYYHCYYNQIYCQFRKGLDFGIGTSTEFNYATEEEKRKLFDAIKDNGYKWNAETKTLEKLPRFKVGDKIKTKYEFQYVIKGITDTHYTLEEVEHKYKYTEPIIEDKNWELVPNKFDINTLKPFDKVLVRLDNANQWYATLFSHIDEKLESFCRRYVTVSGKSYTQMIPYEGNEHLRGTKDNCEDYYKTW